MRAESLEGSHPPPRSHPCLGCPSPVMPKAPWAYGVMSVMAGGLAVDQVPLGLMLLFLCLIVIRSCECKNQPPPPFVYPPSPGLDTALSC